MRVVDTFETSCSARAGYRPRTSRQRRFGFGDDDTVGKSFLVIAGLGPRGNVLVAVFDAVLVALKGTLEDCEKLTGTCSIRGVVVTVIGARM